MRSLMVMLRVSKPALLHPMAAIILLQPRIVFDTSPPGTTTLTFACAHSAVIYFVIGVPVAWILWYYRLYNAAKKDAAFTYAWFFLAYLVHIFWCIWSAVCAFQSISVETLVPDRTPGWRLGCLTLPPPLEL